VYMSQWLFSRSYMKERHAFPSRNMTHREAHCFNSRTPPIRPNRNVESNGAKFLLKWSSASQGHPTSEPSSVFSSSVGRRTGEHELLAPSTIVVLPPGMHSFDRVLQPHPTMVHSLAHLMAEQSALQMLLLNSFRVVLEPFRHRFCVVDQPHPCSWSLGKQSCGHLIRCERCDVQVSVRAQTCACMHTHKHAHHVHHPTNQSRGEWCLTCC
jgi:hypothetical protein